MIVNEFFYSITSSFFFSFNNTNFCRGNNVTICNVPAAIAAIVGARATNTFLQAIQTIDGNINYQDQVTDI